MALKIVFVTLYCALLFSSVNGYSQEVQRSVFSVFSIADENDSTLLVGGQIMAGKSATNNIEHGYLPLNHSLLNLNDEKKTLAVFLFPNPFSETFQIVWENKEEITISVAVYDLKGQLLWDEKSNQELIMVNLSEASKGLYYIQIRSEEDVLFNQKVIKI